MLTERKKHDNVYLLLKKKTKQNTNYVTPTCFMCSVALTGKATLNYKPPKTLEQIKLEEQSFVFKTIALKTLRKEKLSIKIIDI